MKKLFIGFLILYMACSVACRQGNQKQISTNQADKADSILALSKIQDSIANVESIIRMSLAKAMVDQMYEYIEQCELGKISRADLDIIAPPLKAKQDSVAKTLSPEQTKELDEYFQKAGNQMVDRLMLVKDNPQSDQASYSMVSPSSYKEGSPERAFSEFLICWKKQDWGRMVKFTQKTWSSEEDEPATTLEAWYGFKNLLGAKINSVTAISNVMLNITATIYYEIGSDVKPKLITASVICEVAPYTPNSKGEWGVNPISTLREE